MTECFPIYINELEGRVDPSFYSPIYLENEKKIFESKVQHAHLRDIAQKIVDGPFGSQLKVEEYQKSGIPVIRVSNVRTGKIEGNFVYITKEKQQQLERSRVLPGDVILTKAGAILGYSAVFPKSLVEGNITSHLVKIECKDEIVPEYLTCFFKTSLGKLQIYRWGNKSTRPELNTSEVASIIVPIPDKETQHLIIEIMETAFEKKSKKEEEARKLLDSADDFVLNELGIQIPDLKDQMVFVVNKDGLKERIDPYYYQPKFSDIFSYINGLKMVSLDEITEGIINGKTPARSQYSDSGNMILKASNLKNNKINWDNQFFVDKKIPLKATVQKNDILLLSSAHQASYIGKNPCIVEIPKQLADKEIYFVGEIIQIRPKNILPYYLLAILKLNLYYLTINREKRGQSSHIYPKDLKKVEIPLASVEIQEKISKQIISQMLQVDQLLNEAGEIFDDAIIKIEKMILGD